MRCPACGRDMALEVDAPRRPLNAARRGGAPAKARWVCANPACGQKL